MSDRSPFLVIDARPQGPDGPLALLNVLGKPVWRHHLELADRLGAEAVVLAAPRDAEALRHALPSRATLIDGPPERSAAVLATDRIYDAHRLKRALRRGAAIESAVLWRLDTPEARSAADEEIIRRWTYQPIGRFWALAPGRALARRLRPTRVRPNAVTALAAGFMLAAALLVGLGPAAGWSGRALTALALALALVLDITDGHLARLQGTSSLFGRWFDGFLDELGDLALHAAVAWSAFTRDGQPGWLLLGMAYPMGKYLFLFGSQAAPPQASDAAATFDRTARLRGPRAWSYWVGHADVRWHLWIGLALLGRLEVELVAYTAYYPLRALAGGWRKAVSHG